MTSSAGPLLVARDGAIARLTLNRPEKRNALDDSLVAALHGALLQADEDREVRVVTVDGAGPDFCAGADLAALRRAVEADVLDNLTDADRLADLFLAIRRLRKPVVAVVRGRALGGGCGLATACDLVLASEGARFAYTEVRLGFVPAIVMAILRRNVSEKRAFEMLVTGDAFTAAEAERVGLINRVFPDATFEEYVREYVAVLAERSPSAVMLSKRLFHLQDGMELEAAVRAGADLNVLARMTDDTRAGVEKFLASRKKGKGKG